MDRKKIFDTVEEKNLGTEFPFSNTVPMTQVIYEENGQKTVILKKEETAGAKVVIPALFHGSFMRSYL